MTNGALVFVGRIAAQGEPNAVNQTALWLQEIQAIAAVATTLGVLAALYVAVVREPRKAAAEGKRHEAQINALRRAHSTRIAAQARRVVPSCVRTPMFGDCWWTIRIDNTSNAVTTILAVDVKALDASGVEVPDGATQANNTLPVDQAFDRSIIAALSLSSAGGSEQSSGAKAFAALPRALKQAIRDGLVGHFTTEWQRALPPHQHAVMAYTTTSPDYTLRVTIDYEDEAGYQWQRTDTSQPKRMCTDDYQPQPLPASTLRQVIPAATATVKGRIRSIRA